MNDVSRPRSLSLSDFIWGSASRFTLHETSKKQRAEDTGHNSERERERERGNCFLLSAFFQTTNNIYLSAMKLDVLAIGSHPDDVELGCSGTLINEIRKGKKCGIIDLTQGELGTRGTIDTRYQEAADAAKIMGISV